MERDANQPIQEPWRHSLGLNLPPRELRYDAFMSGFMNAMNRHEYSEREMFAAGAAVALTIRGDLNNQEIMQICKEEYEKLK